MLCSDLLALCLLGVLVVCDVGDCSLLVDWLCDVCLTSLYGSNYGWCLRLLLSWCLLLLFGLIVTFGLFVWYFAGIVWLAFVGWVCCLVGCSIAGLMGLLRLRGCFIAGCFAGIV